MAETISDYQLPSDAGKSGPEVGGTLRGGRFYQGVNNIAYYLASDDVPIPADSLAQVLTYSSGKVSTITVQYLGSTYVQTFTYTGDDLTGISQWVKQ